MEPRLNKAVALFERAASLAATWRPGATLSCPFRNRPWTDNLEEIQTIWILLFRLCCSRSSSSPIDCVSGQKVPLVHIAYCLCNSVIIQFRAKFSSRNTVSRAKCLSTAIAIVPHTCRNTAVHLDSVASPCVFPSFLVHHSFLSLMHYIFRTLWRCIVDTL